MPSEMLMKLVTNLGLSNEAAEDIIKNSKKQVASQRVMDALSGKLGFAAIEGQLFPSGPPKPTVSMAMALSSTGPLPLPEDYADPLSGAIRRSEGALVDPSLTPDTGVFYPPDDPDIAGSPTWLENAQKTWSPATVAKWRKRLRSLGYDVDKKGAFTLGFRTALDSYYRNKYFYGAELPLGEMGAKAQDGANRIKPMEAYDPVEARNDIRETYITTFGDEPSDAEMEKWERVMHRQVAKALKRNPQNPAHAQLRAKEVFFDRFLEDTEAEFALESADRAEENTQLRDSFISMSQLISGG
jgi:hypothetical protein